MATESTVTQKDARRKLSLLELASELENVSKTAKLIGYSRQKLKIAGVVPYNRNSLLISKLFSPILHNGLKCIKSSSRFFNST